MRSELQSAIDAKHIAIYDKLKAVYDKDFTPNHLVDEACVILFKLLDNKHTASKELLAESFIALSLIANQRGIDITDVINDFQTK